MPLGGQAVLAREPANAAAERVADDVDRRARSRASAARPCSDAFGGDVPPTGSGFDAGAPCLDVDLNAGHAVELDQQGALERAQGAGVVAGTARHDLEAGVAGRADDAPPVSVTELG